MQAQQSFTVVGVADCARISLGLTGYMVTAALQLSLFGAFVPPSKFIKGNQECFQSIYCEPTCRAGKISQAIQATT